MEAAGRRAERDARRRQRELERAHAAAQRAATRAHAEAAQAFELAQAEHQAALYENLVARLTSIHREAYARIEWRAVAAEPEPSPPVVDRRESARLQTALATYAPTFWERLWRSQRRRAGLEASLQMALAAEAAQDLQLRQQWADAAAQWNQRRQIAAAVLGGDARAYHEVARESGCLDELAELSGADSVRVDFTSSRLATVMLRVDEDHVVPRDEVTLTARGKLSTKRLPDARRAEIYQDYVCGAALRAGRELMAVLPVEAVLVHVGCNLLNRATGHFETSTILSVYCPRERFAAVDFDRVDASDMVTSLRHAMAFRRGKGFAGVQPLTVEPAV